MTTTTINLNNVQGRGTPPRTAAQWVADNPILPANYLGFETDTGKYKIGDGVTAWNSLSYPTFGGGTWGSITGTLSDQTDLQSALDAKLTANSPITGATKTKVTYDANGLITSGADATTADIADSLDKRYITDAQQTILGNTSGTNTGDETTSTIKTKLGAASSLQDGYLTSTDWTTFNSKQAALGFTPEDVANKSTSTSLGVSDTLYPSQNAVKSYVDTGLNSKQDILVNQTNIKSINGTSLLGSGDLTVGGGALSINTQTASYTLVLTDAAKLVRMNVASANDLTIPPNSSVAFDVGTVLYVEQMGAGTTSIVAGSGVTINTTAVKTPYQYGTLTLIQVSANVWNVIGGTV